MPRRRLKRHATVDFWDDQNDVYAVRLKKGSGCARRSSREGIDVNLVLWNPGTRRLDDVRSLSGRQLAESGSPG